MRSVTTQGVIHPPGPGFLVTSISNPIPQVGCASKKAFFVAFIESASAVTIVAVVSAVGDSHVIVTHGFGDEVVRLRDELGDLVCEFASLVEGGAELSRPSAEEVVVRFCHCTIALLLWHSVHRSEASSVVNTAQGVCQAVGRSTWNAARNA